MNYIRDAMYASADYKATLKRIRALHDIKKERASGERPMRMYVQFGGHLVVPEWKPRDRHVFCHSRPRPYGLGNKREE